MTVYAPKIYIYLKFMVTLQDFNHPGLENHTRHWNLSEVQNLPHLLHCIQDDKQRKLAGDVAEQFTSNVIQQATKLLKGLLFSSTVKPFHTGIPSKLYMACGSKSIYSYTNIRFKPESLLNQNYLFSSTLKPFYTRFPLHQSPFYI